MVKLYASEAALARRKSALAFTSRAVKAVALAERAVGCPISDSPQHLHKTAAQYLVDCAVLYDNNKGGPTLEGKHAVDLANSIANENCPETLCELLEDVTGTCLFFLDEYPKAIK